MSPADNELLWLGGGIAITILLVSAALFWLVAELRARRCGGSPVPPGPTSTDSAQPNGDEPRHPPA